VTNQMPRRQDPRLPEYDYSQQGGYFVTICTKDRSPILSQIVGGDAHIAPSVRLTPLGEVVEKYILSMPGIEKYVIMPNHVHFIVTIRNGSMWASTPTAGLPSLVRSFKTLVTKAHGFPVWQRGYYDHILRDDNDFLRVWKYMDENPAHWAEDEYHP